MLATTGNGLKLKFSVIIRAIGNILVSICCLCGHHRQFLFLMIPDETLHECSLWPWDVKKKKKKKGFEKKFYLKNEIELVVFLLSPVASSRSATLWTH